MCVMYSFVYLKEWEGFVREHSRLGDDPGEGEHRKTAVLDLIG